MDIKVKGSFTERLLDTLLKDKSIAIYRLFISGIVGLLLLLISLVCWIVVDIMQVSHSNNDLIYEVKNELTATQAKFSSFVDDMSELKKKSDNYAQRISTLEGQNNSRGRSQYRAP
jgi:hypothetical protein